MAEGEIATYVSQYLPAEKLADFEVFDGSLVLRDLLMLTVDVAEGVQEVG